MSHILTIVQFKSCRIFSELITVKLTAITAANAPFWSPLRPAFCPYTSLFPLLIALNVCSCYWKGFHGGENKPENSQIRPKKSTKLSTEDTVKSVGSFFFLLFWNETHHSHFNDFAIRIFLGLQRIWLLSTWNSQIWRLLIKFLCIGKWISIYSQYPSAYSSMAESIKFKLFCQWEKKRKKKAAQLQLAP